MFGIGTGELLLLLVIALIVLGPERMPKLARDLGRAMAEFRKTSDELRSEFLNADKYLEVKTAAEPPVAAAPTATEESKPAEVTGESAFDREMREARERLRET